jgi:type VI secretion system protein ImpI
VARWQAHAQKHDHGLLDTFMSYFARCYDGG